MSRLFNDTNSLSSDSSLSHNIGTGDFTIMAWVRPDVLEAFDSVWSNGAFSPALYHSLSGGGAWGMYWGSTRNFDTTLTTGVWSHLTVRRIGTTLTGWFNGVIETTSHTVSSNMSNAIQYINQDTSGGDEGNGRRSWVTLWNVGLTSNEILSLAQGLCPIRVRLGNIKACWPIWGIHDPEIDISNGLLHLTINGTPTQANDPPVSPMSLKWWNAVIPNIDVPITYNYFGKILSGYSKELFPCQNILN